MSAGECENFDELCRLCASYDAIKMDIFSDRGKERQLLEKIHTCLPFQVAEDDLLPKSLCYRCIYNLENFYDFRSGCVVAVAKLEDVVIQGSSFKTQKREIIDSRKSAEKLRSLLQGNKPSYPTLISKPKAPQANPSRVHSDERRIEEDNCFDSEEPNPADFLEACLGDAQPKQRYSDYEEEEAQYVCSICNRVFNSKGALTLHSKYHLRGTEVELKELYSCQVCEKAFSSRGHLALHAKTHAGEDVMRQSTSRDVSTPIRPYQCDLCEKSYSMAKHLWGHVSVSHRGDPQVSCQFCGRTFSTIANLEEHKRSKHISQLTDEDCDPNEEDSLGGDLESQDSNENENRKSFSDETSGNRRKNSKPRKINKEESGDEVLLLGSYQLMDTPSSGKPFSCLLCERSFSNRSSLSRHLLAIHGINPDDVDTVHQTNPASSLEESELVESLVEAETVFCCEVCIREFNDRASLWLHMLYAHKDEAATACGICLRVCSDQLSLQEHVETCHPRNKMTSEQRRYSCQVCARQHDSRKKLMTHVRIHNLVDENGDSVNPEKIIILNSDHYPQDKTQIDEVENGGVLSCEVCCKVFPTESKLVKHKRTAHRDSNIVSNSNSYHLYFTCELCGLSLSTRTERWRHVVTAHCGEPSLTCTEPGCGKVFPTRLLLIEHSANHHQLQGETPNTCEVCGKLWGTRVDYWKHMMGVHSDCVPLTCGVCLKVFCAIPDLMSHVQQQHSPLLGGDFCCDVCGRPYSKKSKMLRHRKIHGLAELEEYTPAPRRKNKVEKEKVEQEDDLALSPLKCNDCPTIEFTEYEQLSEHLRSIHNVAPCDLCTKYYGRTSHLWKHVNKKHKNHPDVTCNQCFRTSASRAHLASHMAKHHRDSDTLPTSEYACPNLSNDTDKTVHECTKCLKIFRKNSVKNKHMKHCNGPRAPTLPIPQPVDGSYSCEKCSKAYELPSHLRKHMRSAHVSYHCELCESVSCDSKSELMSHIHLKHEGHSDLTCDVKQCRKMLRCKADVEKHKIAHRYAEKPPTCDFCGELLTNKIKLRKHLLCNHPLQSKHLCAICLEPFENFINLKSHILKDHPNGYDRPNSCPICAKSVKDKNKLLDHIRAHGPQFNPCKICMEVLDTSELLKFHIERHADDVDSEEDNTTRDDKSEESVLPSLVSFKTETLDTDSDSQASLQHSATSNSFQKKRKLENTLHDVSENKIKRYKEVYNSSDLNNFCQSQDVVPRSSPIENARPVLNNKSEVQSNELELSSKGSNFNGRERVYSSDEFLATCEICGKIWPAKSNLWQHYIRNHRQEAASACGVCLKICPDYDALDAHLADAHPNNFVGEKSKFTCRVCGRFHNSTSKLEPHATIHVGHEGRAQGKLYYCSTCNVGFNSQVSLEGHKRSVCVSLLPNEVVRGENAIHNVDNITPEIHQSEISQENSDILLNKTETVFEESNHKTDAYVSGDNLKCSATVFPSVFSVSKSCSNNDVLYHAADVERGLIINNLPYSVEKTECKLLIAQNSMDYTSGIRPGMDIENYAPTTEEMEEQLVQVIKDLNSGLGQSES